jgi:hypothetical protein
MLGPDDLVRALRTVPEKRLSILDLARELANEKGELDLEKMRARVDEVEMADREARAYAQATSMVLRWLVELAR